MISAYQAVTGARFVWRGVANADWPLYSALVRRYIDQHDGLPMEWELREEELKIISEARAPAQRWTFAQRDSTIAALGEVTVVVEAPVGSGALITATRRRGGCGDRFYAVPGPIGAAASAGTNELIAVGAARALTGAPMLLAALGLRAATRAEDDPDDDARVLDALAGSPSDPDGLARRLGLSTTALAAIVARLVIRGRIGTAADGRLARR